MRLLSFPLAMALLVSFPVILLEVSQEVSAYTPHAPIQIYGNAGFTPANGVTGGTGTWNDPYIIEGWEINASGGTGIDIWVTDAYFIVRNTYVHSASSGNAAGIRLWAVANGRLSNLTVSDNYYGIDLGDGCSGVPTSNITVSNNKVSNNSRGIFFFSCYLSGFTTNVILNNNNVWNNTVGIQPGYSMNVIVAANNVSNNSRGIYVSDWMNGIVTANNVSDNNDGIYISGSGINAIVAANEVSNNSAGIYVFGGTPRNVIVTANNVSDNDYGIYFGDWWFPTNVIVTANEVSVNNVGIYLGASTNNIVHHNNLLGNQIQAEDLTGPENLWDDGYPSGGNYWSDYGGVDNCSGALQDFCPGPDGIGDTPHVIDSDSRDGYPLMTSVVIESTPPTVSITSPADGSVFATDFIAVTGNAADTGGSGLARVGVRVNGGVWQVSTGTVSWNTAVGLTTGANAIEARAWDNVGNPSSISSIAVTYNPPPDLMPPTVAIASPADGTWLNARAASVFGTADDTGGSGLDHVEVSCDGGVTWFVATGTSSWTHECAGPTELVEGANVIHARSFDFAGWESSHAVITLNVDVNPPTVTIASPADGRWLNATAATVAGTAAEMGASGLDHVEVSCDGGVTWFVATGTSSWTHECAGPTELVEGANVIHARSFDFAGWESSHAVITLNVDVNPPTTLITFPPEGGMVTATPVDVQGTASDSGGSGLSRVEVRVNGGTWQIATGTTSWSLSTVLTPGPNVLDAQAWDSAGNPSSIDSIAVTYNPPPTVAITSPVGGERWIGGSTHTITWSMQDNEDPDANLTVYVNYTTRGVTTSIVAALKGQESYPWALPDLEATEVVVNITVIDSGGMKAWTQSGPLTISGRPRDFVSQYWWLPVLIVAVAVAVLIPIMMTKRRRKGGEEVTGTGQPNPPLTK